MLKFHREFWAKNIIFKFDVESRDFIFLILDLFFTLELSKLVDSNVSVWELTLEESYSFF